MQYIATLGGRQFAVESSMELTQEQVNSYAAQQFRIAQGGGCTSCGSTKAGMLKLGTANCGGPYIKDTPHTLTGSITSGGTGTITYTWTITKPDTTSETKNGAVVSSYVFSQVGIYKIRLDVTDSCLSGPKSDFATCDVQVNACLDPVCTINIA